MRIYGAQTGTQTRGERFWVERFRYYATGPILTGLLNFIVADRYMTSFVMGGSRGVGVARLIQTYTVWFEVQQQGEN